MLNKKQLSLFIGYKGRTDTIDNWVKSGNSNRYEAVRIGAELLSRGISFDSAVIMPERIKQLEDEKAALERELNDIADKLQGLMR